MSLYTYLTYVTDQIWLPHYKYELHYHYNKWACRPNISAYVYVTTHPTTITTSHAIAMHMLETNMPLKCHICKLVHVQVGDMYVCIYALYKNIRIRIRMHTRMHQLIDYILIKSLFMYKYKSILGS